MILIITTGNESKKEIKKAAKNDSLYIRNNAGVDQPAYLHEDGTIVSKWDAFSKLLICDEDGIRQISIELAKELEYCK